MVLDHKIFIFDFFSNVIMDFSLLRCRNHSFIRTRSRGELVAGLKWRNRRRKLDTGLERGKKDKGRKNGQDILKFTNSPKNELISDPLPKKKNPLEGTHLISVHVRPFASIRVSIWLRFVRGRAEKVKRILQYHVSQKGESPGGHTHGVGDIGLR